MSKQGAGSGLKCQPLCMACQHVPDTLLQLTGCRLPRSGWRTKEIVTCNNKLAGVVQGLVTVGERYRSQMAEEG